MRTAAELLVEPFTEGSIGPHVQAAIDALTDAGLPVEVGPFGTTVVGDHDVVAEAVSSAVSRAFGSGARRVSVDIRAVDDV